MESSHTHGDDNEKEVAGQGQLLTVCPLPAHRSLWAVLADESENYINGRLKPVFKKHSIIFNMYTYNIPTKIQ